MRQDGQTAFAAGSRLNDGESYGWHEARPCAAVAAGSGLNDGDARGGAAV